MLRLVYSYIYYAARWCVNHVTNHTHNLEIFASVTLLLRHRKEAFPPLANSSDPWPFSVGRWDVLWPFDLVIQSLTFWTLEFPQFGLTNFRVGLLWVHDLLKCQHDFLNFLSALECHTSMPLHILRFNYKSPVWGYKLNRVKSHSKRIPVCNLWYIGLDINYLVTLTMLPVELIWALIYQHH